VHAGREELNQQIENFLVWGFVESGRVKVRIFGDDCDLMGRLSERFF
jgi:hypothetical protein